MTSLRGNLHHVEIRGTEAKKEETLKAMQLGPVPRDGPSEGLHYKSHGWN